MNPLQEIISRTPQMVQKSVRTDYLRGGTSTFAGKVLPITYIPVLREDSVRRCQLRVNIEMMETAELLKNAVNINVYAHFVPKLALERFKGSMDMLNASYGGKSFIEGDDPIPYFEMVDFDNSAELNKAMGFHADPNGQINTDFIESYNQLQNFRRRARSTKLPLRDLDDTALARSFWNHSDYKHIVPDYDLAKIEGEVALNVAVNRRVKRAQIAG